MSQLLDYALYNTHQIRICEQQAPVLYHLNEFQLMLQAGVETFAFILREFSSARHLAIFCGSGNNAGDGYVVARLAHQQGLKVVVYQCKAIEDLANPAQQAALEAQAVGVEFVWADEPIDSETDLIVDALLGIGLKGPVRGLMVSAIQQINASGLPVLSVDLPSGLNADNGEVANFCVQATATVCFIGLKVGMYTLDGPDYCGKIYCYHLKLDTYLNSIHPCAQLLNEKNLSFLAPRKRNSHKGDFGHVLVIGGGLGMAGAAALAAKATLRVGAGAVTIATHPEHVSAMISVIPEAMVWGIEEANDLLALLKNVSFCILGPGLGESEWAKNIFLVALSSQLPMVIDASALRLLALAPQTDDNWILTPHPGEAASLLACSSKEIQQDRLGSACLIQKKYGGVVVLKGVGSVIATVEKNNFICSQGNPGMASAGMGDVLSGIIGGLVAQGYSLSEAAKLGVWLHALVGDKISQEQGEQGLLASDLINALPKMLKTTVDSLNG